MHILLTDILTCPRCGPAFGLILQADEMRDRHVVEGRLGCPNCRESFVVSSEVADLGGRGGLGMVSGEQEGDGAEPSEAAFRVAALLGVADAPVMVLLAGFEPALVAEVAALLPNAQVVASAPSGAAGLPPGPSWAWTAGGLPFRDGALRGVALGGGAASLLPEAVRVLARGARLVLDPAPAEARERVEEAGLELLLEEAGVMVASSQGRG
jgi:uncharacterized protein YbaR (Trm112 family)